MNSVWEIVCHLNVYRRTNKMASRLTGRDGIVVLRDGYDT